MHRSLITVLGLLVALAIATPLALAKTIEVPKDFQTVQLAINAAEPGDLILVSDGTYRENLVIKKNLELRGSGPETVVDGSAARSRPTIWVQDTSNVAIKNLKITGGRRGIQVERSRTIVIENNLLQKNRRQGILITENSEDIEIRDNQIIETQPDENNVLGNGIILNGTKEARVLNNTVARNAHSGIRLLSAVAQIERNTIEQNTNYGIEIWPNWVNSPEISSQAVVSNNALQGNASAGVFVTEESLARLSSNQILETAFDKDGQHGHALWVTDGATVVLAENTLARSQGHGLFAASGRVELGVNTLSENSGCGLRVEDGVWLSLKNATLNLENNRAGAACGTAQLLEPKQSLTVPLIVTQTGSLKAQALTLTQDAALLLALHGPGQEEPYAQTQSPDSLRLTFEINSETLALGTRWRAVLTNQSEQNRALVILQASAPFRLGSCANITNDFGIILDQIDAPPFSEPQCNIIYSSLKAAPEGMRRTVTAITNNPSDPQIAGTYTGMGRINLFGPMLRRTLSFVFIHELAHAVQDRFVSREMNTRWRELYRQSGKDPDNFVSDYAQTNQAEDFAETFAEYVDDTLGLLKLVRERAAKGKSLLLEKFKFMAELFKQISADSALALVYQVRVKSDDEKSRLTVRRVQLQFDADGLLQAPAIIEWEEF